MDPPYLHTHKKSIVDQREIGIDTLSYDNALKNAMREAPDVILIGEIRDREVAETAIHAAQTGHLVFSTLHTNSAAGAFAQFIVSPSPSGNLRLQNVHNPSLFLAIRDGMLTSGVGGSHCELFANPHGGNIYSFRAVDGSGAIGVFENGQAKPPFQVGEFVTG